MNTLSWLIYAAEVVDNLGGAVGVTSFFFMVFGLIAAGVATIGSFASESADERKACIKAAKITWPVFIFGLILGLFSQFLPSKEVVYAIAASEMGEVVINNDETREVLQALKGKIMEQLAPVVEKAN